MLPRRSAALLVIGALVTLAGCAAPSVPANSQGASPAAVAAKKRITLAASSSLVSVGSTFVAALPGAADVNSLLDAGLTNAGPTVIRVPQLAESIPSTENGLWKVTPDGKMETTWKLQPNVTWHDGAPFTADDLLFTYN